MYSKLTGNQREAIIKEYRGSKPHATDAGHAVAIVARNTLCKTDRAWNGKQGSDAFAAALATLVMAGEVSIT